jgi:RNA recognition motif-containing protein
MKIYVFNLSSIIQTADLDALFSVYGEVKSAHVVKDIISGESRGFGYIEMNDILAGQRAVEALDQIEIDTLSVSVQEVRA